MGAVKTRQLGAAVSDLAPILILLTRLPKATANTAVVPCLGRDVRCARWRGSFGWRPYISLEGCPFGLMSSRARSPQTWASTCSRSLKKRRLDLARWTSDPRLAV